jgi:hypothetical protein
MVYGAGCGILLASNRVFVRFRWLNTLQTLDGEAAFFLPEKLRMITETRTITKIPSIRGTLGQDNK